MLDEAKNCNFWLRWALEELASLRNFEMNELFGNAAMEVWQNFVIKLAKHFLHKRLEISVALLIKSCGKYTSYIIR